MFAPKQLALMALCIVAGSVFAGCGGNASDTSSSDAGQGGSGLSRAELEQRMLDEVDKLNSCVELADCTPIGLPQTCKSFFVNRDADTSTLSSLTEEYQRRFNPDMSCIDICQCGLLKCQAGKCQASTGSCMEPTTDEQTPTCL